MNESTPKINILLIEDDEQISSALTGILEARDYYVTVINNGKEAIKQLNTFNEDSYSLVLLDIMLPGANGWEILLKLRSLPSVSHYPVIMLTAVDDEVSESRAIYQGADDFIAKPFSVKVLLARIEAQLRKKVSTAINFELHFTRGDFDKLSEREKEILDYVSKGYSNKEISDILFISENTVGNHVSNLFTKLKVSNRTQAALIGLKYFSDEKNK